MRTRTSLAAIALILGCLAERAAADENLYQQGLRSTVWIVAGDISGSGVLVDADQKLVVTNYHVVGDADAVQVCFPATHEGDLQAARAYYEQHLAELAIRGRVTVKDPRRDLALVQLESLPESAVPMPLAADGPGPGDAVQSIGNPRASEALWVYTSGTVRQVYEAKLMMPNGIPLCARIIETQAPVNPGDSGGPAFNGTGQLVGIVQSYQVDAQLVSRCIEISEVKALLRGEIKTWDQRVSKALDAENLKYSVDAYGLFHVSFRDEGEEKATVVFVDSQTNRVGGFEIREVKTLLYTSQTPLPATLANDLLRHNFRYTLGMWCVAENEGTYRLFFAARLDANASSQQLKDAIGHVLTVAKGEADLQVQLTAVQSAEEGALVGTWVAQVKNKDGEELRLQIEFTASGAFSFDDETCLTRGTYKLVEGLVQVEIRGKRRSLGPVRLQDAKQLTLDLGGGDVKFTRMTGGTALAAGGEAPESEATHQSLAGN
jgi:serine protease Do